MASSRFRNIELRKSTASQLVLFFAILVAASFLFLKGAVMPLADSVFRNSFKAELFTSGENLNEWTNWKVVVEPGKSSRANTYGEENETKVYYFDPVLATLPLVFGAGAFIAVIACAIVAPGLGLIRQKIEREIINALHHYARIEYAEHTDEDLLELSETIAKADVHRLHELEDHWHTSVADLETLQRAVLWRRRSLFGRLVHLPDALSLYMQQHFTIRYENSMMGLIYIGAAVLIIIIGLRGLQFIPKDSPSLVLFAISLEFILLIVYAFTLMYTKAEDKTESADMGMSDMQTMFGATSSGSSSRQAEKLLRMFVSGPHS
ncbi:MAG: hypothetical protein RL156_88 [Bacteroidota bacterium]|jgi:hypothetical protein